MPPRFSSLPPASSFPDPGASFLMEGRVGRDHVITRQRGHPLCRKRAKSLCRCQRFIVRQTMALLLRLLPHTSGMVNGPSRRTRVLKVAYELFQRSFAGAWRLDSERGFVVLEKNKTKGNAMYEKRFIVVFTFRLGGVLK